MHKNPTIRCDYCWRSVFISGWYCYWDALCLWGCEHMQHWQHEATVQKSILFKEAFCASELCVFAVWWIVTICSFVVHSCPCVVTAGINTAFLLRETSASTHLQHYLLMFSESHFRIVKGCLCAGSYCFIFIVSILELNPLMFSDNYAHSRAE